MKQWPEHALYSYLARQPTFKLELILHARYTPNANSVLEPKDYQWIESILQKRSDSLLSESFTEQPEGTP